VGRRRPRYTDAKIEMILRILGQATGDRAVQSAEWPIDAVPVAVRIFMLKSSHRSI